MKTKRGQVTNVTAPLTLRRSALLLAIWFGLTTSCAAATPPTSESGTAAEAEGEIVVVPWTGLTWHIPERFFFGIRPSENDPEELWVQFGWKEESEGFYPPDVKGYDILLDIHIRKVDDEDPRNALASIHRANLPFSRVPVFAAAKFNGMAYLGSSTSFHYFLLNNGNAYVTCWLVKADKLMPPQVSPDVLLKKFTCETTFFLPNARFAWVRVWDIRLGEAPPAFAAAHRKILSFIR